MEGRERDLVLAGNQYALIQDATKGHVLVYAGPYKTSLANTDIPVVYDSATSRFEQGDLGRAIQQFPVAMQGDYIVLTNPATEKSSEHPGMGSNNMAKLAIGRKINIRGPASFPLWPGQEAQVVPGHRLKTNQYVVARMNDVTEAKNNWKEILAELAIQPLKPIGDGQVEGDKTVDSANKAFAFGVDPEKLTIGQIIIIITGETISFFIPPTGIEVVPDEKVKEYVRDAVTLERLDYCSLLDESGEKRNVRGPAVVFPTPTETFVEREGRRKFRAVELNDDMGIHLKVIADYVDEDGVQHKVGEEIFLTGHVQRIYFPREEHAVVKYGDEQIHYSVAIPEGEGRYVYKKGSGSVDLVVGPRAFLANPIEEVNVRRTLSDSLVTLLFPKNTEALDYNRQLRQQGHKPGERVDESTVRRLSAFTGDPASTIVARSAKGVGDDFDRNTTFTPPRTITLDTRFQGAVAVNVWNGYAVHLFRQSGGNRVIVGPQTVLLEYDEVPQVVHLSTGKPKTTDNIQETVYLQVRNNQVGDVILAETADLVELKLKLSYRVDFVGKDPAQWFAVDNYVKLLCDRIRSLVKNAAREVGVEEFIKHHVGITRDTILGVRPEQGDRPGLTFKECNAHVYDVEVLGVELVDQNVKAMLAQNQLSAVKQALDVAQNERTLDVDKRLAAVTREQMLLGHETNMAKLRLDEEQATASSQAKQAGIDRAMSELGKQQELEIDKIETMAARTLLSLTKKLEEVKQEYVLTEARIKERERTSTAELEQRKLEFEQSSSEAREALDEKLKELLAQVEAFKL
ncbi:MAG: hypothetical protein HZA95_03025 [Candidatus Vogelbacteria bacterium]|nr:hypothetical protein [Candidatus Vogelbacteria bacterium]